jgi:ubiquinone/menaquinone biosynthesis C-methylase UbiE
LLKKDITLKYDSSAEIYDQRYHSIQLQKYEEIIKRTNNLTKKYVLDLGCGTGLLVHFLNLAIDQKPKWIVGLDLSYRMVQEAKKRNPSQSFVVADSDELPFREETFDTIISVTHLQNLPEPIKSLQEIARTSKVQTTIFISILRKTWTMDKLQSLVHRLDFLIHDSWKAQIEDVGILCSQGKSINK